MGQQLWSVWRVVESDWPPAAVCAWTDVSPQVANEVADASCAFGHHGCGVVLARGWDLQSQGIQGLKDTWDRRSSSIIPSATSCYVQTTRSLLQGKPSCLCSAWERVMRQEEKQKSRPTPCVRRDACPFLTLEATFHFLSHALIVGLM